jgi:hypothetical protein
MMSKGSGKIRIIRLVLEILKTARDLSFRSSQFGFPGTTLSC